MKVLFSHPTGNSNVRFAAKGLVEANILYKFITGLASFPGTILDKLSHIKALSEIKRRTFDRTLQPYTKMRPWYEGGRLLAAKLGVRKLTEHESGFFCLDAVYHDMDKYVMSQLVNAKKEGVTAVYGYEDGAAYSFEKAKDLGIRCYYDLPIGYWRAANTLLKVEAELRPEWVSTLTGFKDSPKKLTRKDQELKLADHIFVASSFTAKTLADFPGKLAPISVIPYGFPTVANGRDYKKLSNRPLKLLFVGGLSQRKGIAIMFEAIKAFNNNVELTIVGKKSVEDCDALNKSLKHHKWIPSLSHDKVLLLMKDHDVLIFPSLFEGFGLVITEAMSQGTPVITTDRTAGPDLIFPGDNGWLVQAGSTEALRNAIENILIQPISLIQAGKSAMNTASKRPWSVYSKEVSETIKSLK